MSVWLCIPSKRPPEEAEPVLKQWRERGYKIALLTDDGESRDVDLQVISVQYSGYAQAVNELIARVAGGNVVRESTHVATGEKSPYLEVYDEPKDPSAEWFVIGGDDVLPDPNLTAEEIARECCDYFGTNPDFPEDGPVGYTTFGVMQPTGDRWGDKDGAYIDRVAGSAWIGREFAKRMYGGKGPLWPEYFHMGCDEELQAVATERGVFWQRPDLTQFHNHWGRPHEGERIGLSERRPAFLDRANSQVEWDKYKLKLAERKAAGWPGSEPL